MDRQPFQKFYTSAAWKRCRDGYAASKHYLCERCRKAGLITIGEEVHHMTRLTMENINDPSVALNWDNLELLCKECHMKEHRDSEKRWEIDEDGNVFTKDSPPV